MKTQLIGPQYSEDQLYKRPAETKHHSEVFIRNRNPNSIMMTISPPDLLPDLIDASDSDSDDDMPALEDPDEADDAPLETSDPWATKKILIRETQSRGSVHCHIAHDVARDHLNYSTFD